MTFYDAIKNSQDIHESSITLCKKYKNCLDCPVLKICQPDKQENGFYDFLNSEDIKRLDFFPYECYRPDFLDIDSETLKKLKNKRRRLLKEKKGKI